MCTDNVGMTYEQSIQNFDNVLKAVFSTDLPEIRMHFQTFNTFTVDKSNTYIGTDINLPFARAYLHNGERLLYYSDMNVMLAWNIATEEMLDFILGPGLPYNLEELRNSYLTILKELKKS